MTTESILKKHGLDFEIKKLPLTATDEDGNQILTPYFGLLNSKSREVINVCKAGYTISQNSDVIDMVLEGMKNFGAGLSVQSAGSINGGRRVYVQLKIEGLKKILNTKYVQYVTVIDSNDGSTGLSVLVGFGIYKSIFYLQVPNQPKFRHTSKIDETIKNITKLIEGAIKYSDIVIKKLSQLKSVKVTNNIIDDFVKKIFGFNRLTDVPLTKRSTKNMNNLYSCILHTDIRVTRLSLLTGLATYLNNYQTLPKRDNSLDETLMCGVGYKKTKTAYSYCLGDN